MKFPSPLALHLLLVAAAWCSVSTAQIESHDDHLRATGGEGSDAGADADAISNSDAAVNLGYDMSVCNEIKDEKKCYAARDKPTNLPCVWCDCQAVPPVCVTPDQATSLPPGVFDCKTPSSSLSSAENNDEENELLDDDEGPFDAPHEIAVRFADGRTHVLKENVMEAGSDGSAICDPSSKSISGYMDIKGSKFDESGDKHLFFWMFEKRGGDEPSNEDTADDVIPFVVWLTGGPGCSSTLALLTENGPCKVNPDGKSTSVNPHSWTEAAHVLWLDQPAGVGFSYGDENDSGEEMVGEDAYYFFQAFFKSHPEYANSPLYIVGESYAGHYVPAIAHRIHEGNQSPCDGCIDLKLSGLAIGNGLTKPEEQYKWYPEMVWNNSHGIKVVDEAVYEAMKSAVPRCVALIQQCNKGDNTLDDFACQTAFVVCNLALTSPYQATGLNPYDIRKQCDVPPLCYDFSKVADFLNLESTKRALNVDESHSHSWNACNYGINMRFHVDWMKDFSHYVSDLLDANIPALIYAGDVDFICNYLGNQAWTLGLDWSHGDDFRAATAHDWMDGAGIARSSNGFTFLQVKDGGHMVPTDQPEVALSMLRTFLAGGDF